jgi:hypothetical protein
MLGKGLRLLVPALALLMASQWQDIRYVKISQLSTGQGPPGKRVGQSCSQGAEGRTRSCTSVLGR